MKHLINPYREQQMPAKPTKGQRVRPVRPVKKSYKPRITAPVKTAIHEMVHKGRTRAEAAEIAGIKDDSLYRALCKPYVLEYKNRVLHEFRESLSEKSLGRVDWLAENSKKDTVKLGANRTLLEIDDRFVRKQQINQVHSGEVKFTPGYVIDLSDDERLISDQVIEGEFEKEDQ